MSDFTNENAERSRRRKRPILWAAAGAASAAAIAAGLLIWKPWVDETPFTAVIGSASRSPADDGAEGGGECTPNTAGKPVAVYDKTGKHKLAEGVVRREGERLPASFGEMAGYCFWADRVEGVPSGRDEYMVQVGGGTMSPMTEKDLRRTADQQREKLKTFKWSDVKEPDLGE
ncbi:hypothetical protein [Streptomyces sp. NPDC049555]|uniref:hypothetical protein n=1 Tax=Streptomyces sp. NPDC049555 TaxID=3154930 RepID=UPI0034421430